MNGKGPGESLDRGEEPLLQADPNEFGLGPATRRLDTEEVASQIAGSRKLCSQHKLWGILGQPGNDDRLDAPLGKFLSEPAEILFEPAHHHRVELRRFDRHATNEALRVKDFHQRGKTVGMTVVRRRGQKQAVREFRCKFPDCLCDLGVDRILAATRRRGVVSFVKDQKRTRAKLAERVQQTGGVRLINEQPLGDQEAARGGPRIDGEAPFVPRPNAAPARRLRRASGAAEGERVGQVRAVRKVRSIAGAR
jgi:hypothetical protein